MIMGKRTISIRKKILALTCVLALTVVVFDSCFVSLLTEAAEIFGSIRTCVSFFGFGNGFLPRANAQTLLQPLTNITSACHERQHISLNKCHQFFKLNPITKSNAKKTITNKQTSKIMSLYASIPVRLSKLFNCSAS